MRSIHLTRTASILAGLAAVCGVGIGAAYRKDIAAARARVASGSLLASTRCGTIEYAIAGDQGPVAI